MFETINHASLRWFRFAVLLHTINAAFFAGCLVFLVYGGGNGPLVLATIGTGITMIAGVAGFFHFRHRAKAA